MDLKEFAKLAMRNSVLRAMVRRGEMALSTPMPQRKARQLVRLEGKLSERMRRQVDSAMSSAPEYLRKRMQVNQK